MDVHSNFAYSLCATAPSPATSGTSLTVTSGEGARFPTGSFDVVIWAAGAHPLWASGGATGGNFEICRATISGDVLTLTRAQSGSTARTIVVGDQVMVATLKRAFTDIEALIGSNAPGYEFDYVENTTNGATTITPTTAASASAYITGNSVAYDGSTRLKVEFFAPVAQISAAQAIQCELYDGSTDLGTIFSMSCVAGSSNQDVTVYGVRFVTPSAASHTFSIRAWKTAGTAQIYSGPGGAGNYMPAYMRVTRA